MLPKKLVSKKEKFLVFLKESQRRFNNRHDNVHLLLLGEIIKNIFDLVKVIKTQKY